MLNRTLPVHMEPQRVLTVAYLYNGFSYNEKLCPPALSLCLISSDSSYNKQGWTRVIAGLKTSNHTHELQEIVHSFLWVNNERQVGWAVFLYVNPKFWSAVVIRNLVELFKVLTLGSWSVVSQVLTTCACPCCSRELQYISFPGLHCYSVMNYLDRCCISP